MSEKIKKCILCGSKEFQSKGDALTDDDDLYNTYIHCFECELSYRLHESIKFLSGEATDKKTFRKMLNVIHEFLRINRIALIDGKKTCFTFWRPANKEERLSKDSSYIDIDGLLMNYPNSLLEKIDRILLNISRIYRNYWDTTDIRGLNALTLFCESGGDKKEIDAIYSFLIDYGYIEVQQPIKGLIVEKISTKGWERIDALRKNESSLKQAFVAMWFPNSNEEKYEFMLNVREAIKTAIRNSGFSDMFIDEKQHNNQIVPEILFEIRNSRFLVADITAHRNGVYYEAGIMEGLGRQVIVCCEKSEFGKRHFDIAQKSAIVYENCEELYKKLVDRIRATIA